MGLETVKDEILGKARAVAASLLEEAKKESAKIISDAHKEVRQRDLESEEALKRAEEALERKEMAAARLEVKKYLFQAKKELIESAFDEARKMILHFTDKEREKIIKELLSRAENEITVKATYCSKRDAKFISGYGIVEKDMLGGIIAENEDSTMLIDYSFDTMLADLRADCLQDAAKILFGDAHEKG